MTQATRSYQSILKQAERLSPRARRQLAETLLRPADAEEQVIVIWMRQFGPVAQARFKDLMDRHNDGQLSAHEREELKNLVARYESLMLVNSETLLKTTYPELFTHTGRLARKKLERTLRQRAQPKRNPQSN
jgi:hypothetical protein